MQMIHILGYDPILDKKGIRLGFDKWSFSYDWAQVNTAMR